MNTEKLVKQLHLAAEIIKHNHPWEYYDNYENKYIKGEGNILFWINGKSYTEIRPILAQPLQGKLHNPNNLTAEQVGVGYRLLTKEDKIIIGCQLWSIHSKTWVGIIPPEVFHKDITYRVALSHPWPVVDPYKELKEAYVRGEVIQINYREDKAANYWVDIINPIWEFPVESYRIKPWEMPKPPEGKEWHRNDFTKEMLDGGYRPLTNIFIEDEGEYEYSIDGKKWAEVPSSNWKYNKPNLAGWFRTKRPLPVDQPLGPEDIVPGSFIRRKNNDGIQWVSVAQVGEEGINTYNEFISWNNLMKNWQIITTGGTWKPCKK